MRKLILASLTISAAVSPASLVGQSLQQRLNRLLDAREAGGTDLARFDEPVFHDLMRRAAGLRGAPRGRAYAELDLLLSRDRAPVVPTYLLQETTLVSARVPRACVLRRPSLVLTTVCLKS